MAGRIASYIHSDATTPNKGGCMVEVSTETDFGARTPGLIEFADKVAKYAYGAQALTWESILAVFPELAEDLRDVSTALKEKIEVRRIVIMVVTDRLWEEQRARRNRTTVQAV